MIGEECKAFYLATAGLETARAHTAARSLRVLDRVFEAALGEADRQTNVESVLAGKLDARLDTSLGRRDLERMLDLIARATGALSAPLAKAAA
jgi:hypothetical protein